MITDIDHTKCTGCALCIELCITDVLRLNTTTDMVEVPPCQEACPAGVNIRGFIYLVKQGKLDEAVDVIRKSLPLPGITGYVCHHPCESGCARKKVDEPVNIKALERFIADYTVEQKAKLVPKLHVEKVAIIGSGPAGLSAAYFLTKLGYRVGVFESSSAVGGMLRIGIPEHQLPEDVLNAQVNFIRDMGIEFKTDITVGKDLSLSDIKDSSYNAVILAIGSQADKKLNGEGMEQVSNRTPDLSPFPMGVEIDTDGNIIVDPVTMETTLPGLFACGEAVSGRTSVIKAIASGKRAAMSVDHRLHDKKPYDETKRDINRVKEPPKEGVVKILRQETPLVSMEQRGKAFKEVSAGLNEEMAMNEAERCMACGSKADIAYPDDCQLCYQCELECPTGAIKVDFSPIQRPLVIR